MKNIKLFMYACAFGLICSSSGYADVSISQSSGTGDDTGAVELNNSSSASSTSDSSQANQPSTTPASKSMGADIVSKKDSSQNAAPNESPIIIGDDGNAGPEQSIQAVELDQDDQ